MKHTTFPLDFIRLQNIVVNKEFLPILEENHLTSFPSLMNYPQGQVVKRLIPERSTVTFELKSRNHGVSFFLKRYYPLPFKERLTFSLNIFSLYTALREWNNILTFHKLHLPTVIPVAAGMRRKGIWGRQSFLLTKGLEGTERLEDLIPKLFSLPLPPQKILEKRTLIRQLALLTQRMHDFGLNHRDFYLCHILARKDTDKRWELFICDLHRLDRRKKVRMHWRIKDLAALNYSAPENIISRTDRVRFLKLYLGKEKLDGEARVWIEKIVNKTKKMVRHNTKRKDATQLLPSLL
jgi:heptose I phosphotransferase